MDELVEGMAAADARAAKVYEEGSSSAAVSRAAPAANASATATPVPSGARIGPFADALDAAVPKLQALGIDVSTVYPQILREMDTIVDARVNPVIQQVERSIGSVDGAVDSTTNLVDGVERDGGKLRESISPLDKFAQFPAQLRQLHDDILLAVKNPTLLLPNLACGGQPVDFDEVMRSVVGDDEGERDREAVGNSARDREWKAVEEIFVESCTPLNTLLPLLQDAVDLFDDIAKVLRPMGKLKLALKQYGGLQRKSEGKSAELRDYVKDLLNSSDKENRESSDRALPAADNLPFDIDVRKALDTCLGKAGELKEIYNALDSAVDLIPLCKQEFTTVFTNLEHTLEKLSKLDLGELKLKLRDIKDVYPKVLETARRLCKPSGLLACVMVPSPYFERLDASVTRVQSFLNVEKEADGITRGFGAALEPLGLSEDTLRSRAADNNSVRGSDDKNDLPQSAIGYSACGGIQESVNDIMEAAADLKTVLKTQSNLDNLDDELIGAASRVLESFVKANIPGAEQLGDAAEQVLSGASNFLGKFF